MKRTLPLAALLFPVALAAQVPGSSTRALGMGNAYTALARGYEAIAWNPAMLAVSHHPGLTIGLPQGLAQVDNNSFTVGDIRKYADQTLTQADKDYLLSRIVNDDSTWIVDGTVSAHALGFSIGTMAFSYSAAGYVRAQANRDVVDLALNGNGQFTGTSNFFRLAGSGGNGWAASTLAGSYAMPLHTSLGKLSVGGTGKYVLGSFLGLARDEGSQVSGDSINAHGELMYTEYQNGNFSGLGDMFGRAPGHGFAVDIGGALELSNGMVVSVALVNFIGNMSWDKDQLRFDRTDYTLRFQPSGIVSDTSNQLTLRGSAIDSDPRAVALRDTLLSNSDFSRVLRGGVALKLAGIRLGGDLQLRLSEGLDRVPSTQFGVGGEYVLLGFLPLRAGFRSDFAETTAISVGTGLKLGAFNLDVSAAEIMGSKHPGAIVGAGIGLFF